MDPFTILIILAIFLVGVVLMLGGAVQTFRRQPVVAILCVIFLFPIWLIWAFVEIFLPRPGK
ncbi:MAG: hypothetical protein ACE37J_14385 [Pikeienuella sp.]|uniref:hypothetical protein n=1 Tax=Pikeienuella sp. TaxID=2831957 RepID=UPI00391C8C87